MRMRTSAGVGGKGRRFEERTRISSPILLALPVLLRDEVASRACAGLNQDFGPLSWLCIEKHRGLEYVGPGFSFNLE